MNNQNRIDPGDLANLIPRFFTINIPPDNMLVEGILKPRKTGVQLRDEMPLLLLLNSLGIRYGVIPANVRGFVEALAKPSEKAKTFVLARGKQPGSHTPPRMELFFKRPLEEIRELTPLSGDEFRQKIFDKILIRKDGIAARVYKPERSSPGITVKRQELPAIQGTPPPLTFKRGFRDEARTDHVEYTAVRDGIPRIYGSTVIQVPIQTVDKTLVIQSPEEYQTNLFVAGDITGEGDLKVDGSLYVQGKVLNTNLDVTGNIIVADRVMGRKKSRMVCKGHFSAGQIEGVELKADGIIVVREALFNSSVVGDLGVEVVDGSGAIVGGNVESCGRIKARRVGTARGVRTVLQMRDQLKYRKDLHNIQETIKELLNSISLVERIINSLKQTSPQNQILARKQQHKIHEMLEKRMHLLTKITAARAIENHYSDYTESMKNKRIEVLDNIYPGVEIKFNDMMQEILNDTGAIEITGIEESNEKIGNEEINNERR